MPAAQLKHELKCDTMSHKGVFDKEKKYLVQEGMQEEVIQDGNWIFTPLN